MDAAEYSQRLRTLVDSKRAQCLWYLKEELDLGAREVQRVVLAAIQKHGSLAAFKEARVLLDWHRAEAASGPHSIAP